MRKLILLCGVCLIAMLVVIQDEARAQLDEPAFELEKVIGNIYVGRQFVPLEGLFPVPGPGFYLTVNLFVIASEDKSEVVLIDAPALPELVPAFLAALGAEFPGAEIKGVFLTHDHLDHCWSIQYFVDNGIPVYASLDEINSPLGVYDVPLFLFPEIIPLAPGDSFTVSDGAALTAVDLAGHTVGQVGYAYYPNGDDGKINWFFASDALMAPQDHGVNDDPFNITYFVRLEVLATDTHDFGLWETNINGLKGLLTTHAKLFPSHGAVREGYLFKNPIDYIDRTIEALEPFLP